MPTKTDATVQQKTIRLCGEKRGCRVHLRFHEGDPEAAEAIRKILREDEVAWIIEQVGEEWLQTIYPLRIEPDSDILDIHDD